MNIQHAPYPPNSLSDFLRRSAWGNHPAGLYPAEGLVADIDPVLSGITHQFTAEHRKVVQSVFRTQMGDGITDQQRQNIDRLSDTETFVVVTGQQIHVGLGPAYVLYKIVSTINYCRKLNEQRPTQHFVPVFWMASEDHDVAEIASVQINQDTYTWQKEWHTAVGDMPTDDLIELFDWLQLRLGGGDEVQQRIASVRALYLAENATLASVTQQWVSALFGAYGLLVLDPRDVNLKRMAQPLFEQALFGDDLIASYRVSTEALKAAGQTPPVHVGQSLLFWMDDKARVRIEKTVDGYHTINGSHQWTATEMRALLGSEDIQQLSPNVLLRPLYQQAILPCVSYVGGPSEYLYWLQTTQAFQTAGMVAPQLLHRKGGVVITPSQKRKLDKLDMSFMSFFAGVEPLKQQLIAREQGENELLNAIKQSQTMLEQQLKTLYQWKSPMLSESKKQIDAFVKWNRKMGVEATDALIETKFSPVVWDSITSILTANFSLTAPQERKLFWVQYYFLYGQNWIDALCDSAEFAENQSYWMIEL